MIKILSLIIAVLLILFVASALYKKVVLKKNIKFFNMGVFLVNSGSMQPELFMGDAILIKKYDDYQIGDIITYKINDKYFITHRIIEKQGDLYITKGDFNNAKDVEKVDDIHIEGKVIFHSKTLRIINNE
ncbi:MAG: signal peptidase I [Clostridia bacterium]|nr:signal peptidase I [Clostridia bacterium]